MKLKKISRPVLIVGMVFSSLVGIGLAAQQDKYTLNVPGGLAFSEFRGYEGWQAVSSVTAKGRSL